MRRLGQAAATGDAFALEQQLLDFGEGSALGPQFPELVAQQVEPRLAIVGGRLQGLQFASAVAVARVDCSDCARHFFGAGMPIEHFALCVALYEMLEFLLAVNFEQQIGEFAQRLHRHELAVDVGPRAAVRADDAAQENLAIVVDRLRLEPGRGGRGKPREGGGCLGALRAASHDVGAGAAAREHRQGIDDDRFAGTRLSGQCREPGAELQIGAFDNDKIAQLQQRQHSRPSRESRRRRRLGPSAASSAAAGNNRSPAGAAA